VRMRKDEKTPFCHHSPAEKRYTTFILRRYKMCKERLSINGAWLTVLLLMGVIIMVQPVRGDLTIQSGNYQIETYAVYQQTSSGGRAKFITSDNAGNIYVTHDEANLMIASNGSASVLASGFNNLQGIEWTGGTLYGDFLYAAEVDTHRIKQIDISGNVSTFASLSQQPIAIAHDSTGNYDNELFVATRSSSKIYGIDEFGSESEFLNIGALTDGSPLDLAFDSTGSYNGYMYMSLSEISNTNYQGILAVDPQGSVSQYMALSGSMGYWGSHLAFDTTANLDFGGNLYFGGGGIIRGLTSQGNIFDLLQSDLSIRDFTFSSDGALYVLETETGSTASGNVTISKVTLVPEPTTLLLLSFGAITTSLQRHKRKA